MLQPEDGRFLRMLIALSGAKNALEIGSGVCYSSLHLSLGLARNGGRLTTIEPDGKLVRLARLNLRAAGAEAMVNLIAGDALQVLPGLKESFDLVFIDGHKPDYLLYFDRLMPLVKVGGLIAAHDIAGMPDHMRDYFDMLKVHPCLETVITADNTDDRRVVVSGPGIALSRKTGTSMDGVADWGRRLASRVVPVSPEGGGSGAAIRSTVLKEYREAHFSGAALLVDGSVGEDEVVALCRFVRRRYARTAPGDDLSIHVYKDREAFGGRNDLNLPAERYFAGYAAQIRVVGRTGCDEIRCFSGLPAPTLR
ncbi:MAG: hypothetical protein A2506_06590 [Elusimicrobia bacterium RIFOXYD12_FULL_66_9]|nr:MAG: hypothetical protein A2506_06590 [Elusimicrobia bacterium RIFOXYD12_FULL_66_9]